MYCDCFERPAVTFALVPDTYYAGGARAVRKQSAVGEVPMTKIDASCWGRRWRQSPCWRLCLGQAHRRIQSTETTAAVGLPPPNEVPLDPTDDSRSSRRSFRSCPSGHPTVIKNSSGQVIRNEYTITDSEAPVQMLPAGFPKTTVFARTGRSWAAETSRGSPARPSKIRAAFPTVVHWRTNIQQPYFLPVDPTIAWANPQAIEEADCRRSICSRRAIRTRSSRSPA